MGMQSSIPRSHTVPFLWERMFPGRKDSLIYGNAISESEFGQDNGLIEIQGARCKTERGPQIFTEGPDIFYHSHLKITI